MENKERVIVLDFGGQYNQLIARRVRECNVYCEILPYTVSLDKIKELNPTGIIFTGGPNSVYDESSPHIAKEIFELNIPILGICYGCQLMAYTLGGVVTAATDNSSCEYGKTMTNYNKNDVIFANVPGHGISWMSHRDYISTVPDGFSVTATTAVCPVAAMSCPEKKLYGVQFHPEVNHTENGKDMLRSFLYDVCGCRGEWQMDSFIDTTVAKLKEQIGDKGVVLGLSGGVDSSVAAYLMKEAGYDCIGVTMKLYDNEDIGMAREKTCCSLSDIEDARSVCVKLGIPYYVFNFKDDFKEKVIDNFISCYQNGMTPNPCIECNRHLKFEHLYKRAKVLHCDVIVTGHYAKITHDEQGYHLLKGVDDSKDQSYVLYSLTQEQLANTCFTLGDYS